MLSKAKRSLNGGCSGSRFRVVGMIVEVPDLTAAEFEGLGVYDASAPHAPQRLQLLEYLVSLGATADDLVAYRDQLPGLASVVAIRGGRALTVSEAVERAGIPRERLVQID